MKNPGRNNNQNLNLQSGTHMHVTVHAIKLNVTYRAPYDILVFIKDRKVRKLIYR